jgi:hypothetical protein
MRDHDRFGKADPAERMEVTVVLRHRATDSLKDRVAKLAGGPEADRTGHR